MSYDAFLLVSFGGPEGPDDVMPFLRNVTRGRGIPEERLLAVAEHYQHFGGVSPINGQCRDLLAAIEKEFAATGVKLPLYWGNRNWDPYLVRHDPADARRRRHPGTRVRDQPVRVVLVVPPVPRRHRARPRRRSARARRRSTRSGTTTIIQGTSRPHADGVRAALAALPANRRTPLGSCSPRTRSRARSRRRPGRTAAPIGTSRSSERRPASSPRWPHPASGWDLVWQSRSGPPTVPWLEPDVNDHLEALAAAGYDRRGGQPDRLHLRSPGGRVGPRQRGGRHGRPARP